ncbi:MAG: MFS transporter [Candidatus Eremiobacteraeota bacterium]|nr:MFS transporter [Candidatus Eremiobacteraeota bacterium]
MAQQSENSKAEKPDSADSSPYRYVIEVLIFLTYAAFGMTWAAAGPFLKRLMHDLGLTLSQGSFMTTSVSFAKIFGPTLAGALMARLGLRWAFMAASALICVGILAPMSPSYGLILLARFAMGIGGAMVVVYFTPVVMKWFSSRERLVINGINFVAINVGMTISLFITPYVQAALGDSWQKALIAYSLVSVVLAVAWLILGRDAEEKSQEGGSGAGEASYGYAGALRDANTWKLAFTYMGALSLYLSIVAYFPKFYGDKFGEAAGFWILHAPAVAMAMGIPASIIGIMLTQSTGLRLPFVRWAGLLLIPSVLGMFLLNSTALSLAASVMTGFCLFIWASPFFTIPQELPGMTAKKSGYLMGIFWGACYIAATFNVWLVGKIAEMNGNEFLWGFVYITIVSSSMFLGSFLLPETGPRAKPAPSLSHS